MSELSPAEAKQLVEQALLRWGATARVADCVADHLVDAELAGHPSHGIRQMIRYHGLVERGECDLRVEPVVLSRSGAVTRIDGGGGMGHPAAALAVDLAAGAATEFGVGMSAVIRCGHAGRMGAWAERGVSHGMVTLVVLAASDPPFQMAASAGSAPALQTNPIAIGVPAEGAAFVLDMATSLIAGGKAMVAHARGEQVPEGAMIDASGQPTTDPGAYFAGGALLPAAGHKGFALAAIIEAMSTSFIGADEPGLAPVSGTVVICADAGVFRPIGEVRSSVEVLRHRLHAAARTTTVYAPGEPEALSRKATSVSIDEDVVAILEGESSIG
jgi:LDH2 family malate/lactate/ureidoglycolate dehydrogenase